MKNARGSCCSVQNEPVQSGVTFHVSDFQLSRLSFNDTCSRQAGVAVMQALRGCLAGISTGSSAIPSDVSWFSPVSPEDYPDITRLYNDPFLPDHLQFIHEIISPFYVLVTSHWLRRKVSQKKLGKHIKITAILYSRWHLLQWIAFVQNAMEFVRATLYRPSSTQRANYQSYWRLLESNKNQFQ